MIKLNDTETTTTYAKVTNKDFWRNKITWRSTVTGMNSNVIDAYAPSKNKKNIIRHIKANTIPYEDGRRYIPRSERKYNVYFTNLVNECMEYVWDGKRGFVYSEDQLREVIKIAKDINVEYSEKDMCYYCWKFRVR